MHKIIKAVFLETDPFTSKKLIDLLFFVLIITDPLLIS
jgi:hypothetical protein